MEILTYLWVLFILLSGTGSLCILLAHALINGTVYEINFIPKSLNETEYELRRLLIKYPNAIISTTQNPISERLAKKYMRIIIRPGI